MILTNAGQSTELKLYDLSRGLAPRIISEADAKAEEELRDAAGEGEPEIGWANVISFGLCSFSSGKSDEEENEGEDRLEESDSESESDSEADYNAFYCVYFHNKNNIIAQQWCL